MLCKNGSERFSCRIRHSVKRKSAIADLHAHHVHCFLNGDGVNIAEKRTYHINHRNLKVATLFDLTIKEKLTNIVSFLGENVRKHRDNTDTAERKDRNYLIVIARVDIKIIAAKITGSGNRDNISVCLFGCNNIGVL